MRPLALRGLSRNRDKWSTLTTTARTRDDGAVRLRLCVAGAAVVAIGLISLSIARDEPTFTFAANAPGAAALLVAGWSLTAAGIVLRGEPPRQPDRTPARHAGAAWLLVEWGNPGSGSDVVFTVGRSLFAVARRSSSGSCSPIPSGDWSAVERVIVGAAFVAFVAVLGVAPALFFDPADEFCSQCPDNLALDHGPTPTTADDFSTPGSVLGGDRRGRDRRGCGLDSRGGLPRGGRSRGPLSRPVRCISAPSPGRTLRSADRGFVGTGDVERRLWFVEAVALTGLALGRAGAG